MNRRAKGIAIGTLVAGAMGYVAGILTAPKTGRESREYLNRARTKGITDAEKTLKRLHTELNELLGEAEDKAKSTAQSAKKSATSNKFFDSFSRTDTKSKTKDTDANSDALEGEVVGKATSARQKARDLLSAVHDGRLDDRDLEKAVVEATKAVQSIRKFLKK